MLTSHTSRGLSAIYPVCRTYLVEIKCLRQSPNIKFPSSCIPNPTLSLLCRVPIFSPSWVWQNLQYLLWLRIAVWITQNIWLLQMLGIAWRAIYVISLIWEVVLVRPMNSGPIWKSVIRRAWVEILRFAPWIYVRVYDHLAISSNVRRHVPVARLSIVLPTASYVHEIELALWTPSFLYV